MSQCEIQPPKPSPAFEEVLQETEYLAECLEVELVGRSRCRCLTGANKDITRIASWIDPALLGGYVKAVQRSLVCGRHPRGPPRPEQSNLTTSSITTWTCCSGVVDESLYLRLVDGEAKK